MKSNRHDINRIDAKAVRAKLKIQQNANLFWLNRVTDAELSNGRSLTSNYQVGTFPTVYFSYRDINGVTITSQSGDIASAAYYGLEWVGENSFVYCDASGVVARLDYDPVGDVLTRTEIGDFPGAASHLDIDELGNIYTGHQASGTGVRKTSPDGSVSITGTGSARIMLVDGSHLFNNTATGLLKRDRDTLALIDSVLIDEPSGEDSMVLTPEHVIYMRRTVLSSRFYLIKKSDMSVEKDFDSDTMTNWFRPRRMVQSLDGRIYVLTRKADEPTRDDILVLDSQLNYINRFVLTNINANEMAYAPTPYNMLLVRSGSNHYWVNMSGNIVSTWSGGGLFQNAGRFLNAHPGRAAIKFKVLGLTKQF